MQTVYFSNRTEAEVSNVKGDDPRTFSIPTKSYNAFAEAMVKGATMQFEDGGPVYLLTDMQGSEGRAVLQETRR